MCCKRLAENTQLRGRAGSPSNKKSPGLRPTSMPSAILIHPAVWPQQTWAENWGGGLRSLAPRKSFDILALYKSDYYYYYYLGRGELGPHLTQCRLGLWAEAYLRTKWHLDTSSRLSFLLGVAGSQSNTKSPGLRPTSMPSTNLIHPAVWPQ